MEVAIHEDNGGKELGNWNLAHQCLWEDPSLHSRKLLLQCYANASYLSDIPNGIQPFHGDMWNKS